MCADVPLRSSPPAHRPLPTPPPAPNRITTALTFAIRLAKNPVNTDARVPKEYRRIDNESRPDQAFVTERAQKTGRANASSGRIMVTIPNDHFGPIGPEHDPTRNLVGACGLVVSPAKVLTALVLPAWQTAPDNCHNLAAEPVVCTCWQRGRQGRTSQP